MADRQVRALFGCWGYQPVVPPTLAYAESMSTELGSQMAQDLYRFIDREGRAQALRADLTVPVARIVGTRLYDQSLPLRLSHAERAFRHIRPQTSLRREFTQAGAELIPLQGSVELGLLVGLSDLLVDLVQTGSTLRANNGLVELQEIASFEAALIVNRASQWTKQAQIADLTERLAQVVNQDSGA